MTQNRMPSIFLSRAHLAPYQFLRDDCAVLIIVRIYNLETINVIMLLYIATYLIIAQTSIKHFFTLLFFTLPLLITSFTKSPSSID